MALHSVCSSCVKYKFKSSFCSFTAISLAVISVIVITIPFIVAYRAQGLWLKEDSYREQPDVHFKYEYFFMAETEDIETQVVCTSFDSLSGMRSDVTNCPTIRVREEDVNLDGRNDILYFELEALLPGVDNVQGVTLILLFDYKLNSHSWLRMECLGLIREVSPLGGRSLEVTGELRLHQRTPLMSSGRDTRYNESVFKTSGVRRSSHFDLPRILADYSNRNVSARLENTYSSWRRGRSVGDSFLLKVTISYPEDTVLYTPGIWQVLKHAWVQYLALLVPFFFLGSKIKIFLLESRILTSVKEYPWKKTT